MTNKLKMINKEKLVNEMIDYLIDYLYISKEIESVKVLIKKLLLKVIENHNILDKINQVNSNEFRNRTFWNNNLRKINKKQI